MNLSRGRLSHRKPRRFAPACLAVSALALLPLRAHSSPAGPSSREGRTAEADALPGRLTAPAGDLLLSRQTALHADALASFAQAIISEDNADSDKALEEYQKALALDPGYAELAVKVAFERARRGDTSGGIEVLKDAVKASPKEPLPYLYLSQLYSKYLNKPEIGLKYAQQALDLDPNNLAAYLAVYEICRGTKQDKKAADVLERAAAAQTSDPQFWQQLGDFTLRADTDAASGALPSADQLAKISAIYRKGLALAGENDIAALTKTADFYRITRQEKEAIPLYLKALKFSPATAEDGDQTLSSIRDSLAKCLAAEGQTDSAIQTLQELVKENPLRYESYELLADLYEKKGATDAALAVCREMMVLDPSQWNNYVRTAALQMKEKKFDAAIATLNEARLKFPTEAQVTYSLGLAQSEAKRFGQAVKTFDQAIQDARNGQTQMLDSQFYFAYGAAAEQTGDVAKAADLLKKSIELDPENSGEACNYLGYMWVDRGLNLDEAGDWIMKALALEPDKPAYMDSLGWYYFKKGDLKQAIEKLKKAAVLIRPEDSVVDEHLGDVYSAANDLAQALTYWQKAAALDQDNKEIAVKIAAAKDKLAHASGPKQASATP